MYTGSSLVFNTSFLKFIQHTFHSFSSLRNIVFPKKEFRISRKVQHISHRNSHSLNEWTFTKINSNKFFPSFFCEQSERVWKQFCVFESHGDQVLSLFAKYSLEGFLQFLFIYEMANSQRILLLEFQGANLLNKCIKITQIIVVSPSTGQTNLLHFTQIYINISFIKE